VDTDFGKGLVFERVVDFDGEDSKFLRNCLQENIFTKDQEKRLLDDLKKYLEDNEILFIDCSSHNVFCKKVSADKYTLIIYDGLGARRDNIKLTLYMKSRFYTRYKIKKQWKLFMKNCEKAKNLGLKK